MSGGGQPFEIAASGTHFAHANFKVYLEVDPNYHKGSSLNRFVWEEVGEGAGIFSSPRGFAVIS